MTKENCWLPELLEYDTDSSWTDYERMLYVIYKHDFIETHPEFNKKQVNIRFQPIIDGYEESFIHFTCRDYDATGKREPDFRRCERIRWIRAIIENYLCRKTCDETNCSGIKIWKEPYKMYKRIHFLFEDERYLVILEEREDYCLLVTAYYLDYANALEKQLKHYALYKAKDAPNGTSSETPSTTSR